MPACPPGSWPAPRPNRRRPGSDGAAAPHRGPEAAPQALGQDGEQGPRLHLADRRQRQQAGQQVAAVARLAPHPRGISAVGHGNRRAQRLHPARHRAREAVQGWALAEDPFQLAWIHGRDAPGIQVPNPAAQLGRSGEGFLDGHLLVQGEADEEGERVAGQQAIGLVVTGEGEALEGGGGGGGHAGMVAVSASRA